MNIGQKPQPILASMFLVSGAALIASIILKMPLAITLAGLFLLAFSIIATRFAQLNPSAKKSFVYQITTGIIAGIFATLAYDISRSILVAVGQLEVSPFEAFRLFGELIIGTNSAQMQFAIGSIYHLLNGVTFATAYVFLLGNRNWKWGIVWGLALETAMLTIYPGWLNLNEVMAEFISMSVLGHIAYGCTLGLIAQRRSQKQSSIDIIPE